MWHSAWSAAPANAALADPAACPPPHEKLAGKKYDSGLVMYPAGHARNTTADLRGILAHKFSLLGGAPLSHF